MFRVSISLIFGILIAILIRIYVFPHKVPDGLDLGELGPLAEIGRLSSGDFNMHDFVILGVCVVLIFIVASQIRNCSNRNEYIGLRETGMSPASAQATISARNGRAFGVGLAVGAS